jgi:hypothetical protein
MSIYVYDRKCFFRGSPVIFLSYFSSWHCMLYQRIQECFFCILLPSGSHSLNFLRSESHSYITAHQCYQHHFTYSHISAFLHEKKQKKRKNNPSCVEDEVSISDMLSVELDSHWWGDEFGKLRAKCKRRIEQHIARKWVWEWNKCCMYWWVGRRYDGRQETQRIHIY